MKIGCKILLVALFLCSGGCVIESRQLQTLRQLFFEPDAELSAHVWEVEFAGYSALVTPVVADGKTFFVNDSSDLLKFNGWIITEAKGLKRFERSWVIFDEGKERHFSYMGQIKAVHTCEPWVNIYADTYTQFLQSCTGERDYTNTILVDSLGRIISIEQVLDDSGNNLSLQLRED